MKCGTYFSGNQDFINNFSKLEKMHTDIYLEPELTNKVTST
jgi:hypothetical protein